MKIDNIKVYGLVESIVASGLPMVEEYSERNFSLSISFSHYYWERWTSFFPDIERHLLRAIKLASSKGGESHDCFLCGIIVQMNITAPRYWWPEFQRYHFADIVSSTSTMHRLSSFVKKAKTLPSTEELWELVGEHFDTLHTQEPVVKAWMDCALYGNLSLEQLKASLPEGWLQTARITTNYRQLKTMYRQRFNHRLKEWRDFCDILKHTLPMPEFFTTTKEEGK